MGVACPQTGARLTSPVHRVASVDLCLETVCRPKVRMVGENFLDFSGGEGIRVDALSGLCQGLRVTHG